MSSNSWPVPDDNQPCRLTRNRSAMEMVTRTKLHFNRDAFRHTNFRAAQVHHPNYSSTEIIDARDKAKNFQCQWNYRDPIEYSDAWSVVHTLTSDSAWGGGLSHKVDASLMDDVKQFFRNFLTRFEPFESLRKYPTVVDYMITYKDEHGDPSYLWMLRAYIYGFSHSLNDTIDTFLEYSISTTALGIAANYPFPIVALKTLLEAGVSVDVANDDGDTSLMLCIRHTSDNSNRKILHLINYGANIDRYNVALQNVMHIAVRLGNPGALRIFLQNRKDRIRNSSRETRLHRYDVHYDERFRRNDHMNPDPLHQPDQHHETPLMVISRSYRMSIYLREEIVTLLVGEGAVADENLHQKRRIYEAEQRGGGEDPPCWGVIHCGLIGNFLMFITMQKDMYSVKLTMEVDFLVRWVDKQQSVLPPATMTAFDIRMLFISCIQQRFDFDAAVNGLDFDLHFNVTDANGFDASVVGYTTGSEYKLAVRLPRGPCPISLWTDALAVQPLFVYSIEVDKHYTLSHHAAKTICPEFRRRLVYIARPLCNPLLKCVDGFTSADILENSLTVMSWDVKQLLKKMRGDNSKMLRYIHRDSLLVITEFNPAVLSTTKKRKFKSPFHDLSDDICRIILSFI
jgi:hypothetical protein